MFEWLKQETTDARFIMMVIFAFFLILVVVSAIIHSLRPQEYGPDPEPTPIKDGKGKHRDSTRKPDAHPKPNEERYQVRFVDKDEDGNGFFIDEKSGEVLTD